MPKETKEDCGCGEPEKMGRGGMFKGPSHDGGGIPVVVKDTGQEVEVEGKEPLIPREVIEDDVVRTRKGTNKEIVNEVLKKEGTSIKNTPKEVLGGDNVICKRAIHDDDTVRKITGTDAQIISAVNESGGCKQIEPGAKVVEMREGGSIFKFYWRYKPKSDLDKMLKTKMFAAKDALKWLDENRADVDFAIMYDAATKKIAGTYFKGKTNLVSEELKREKLTFGGEIGAQGKKVNWEKKYGRLGFEIDDTTAEIDEKYLKQILSEVLDNKTDQHPTLNYLIQDWDGYLYYPGLKNLIVSFIYDSHPKARAAFYSPRTKQIYINVPKLIEEYEKIRQRDKGTTRQVQGNTGTDGTNSQDLERPKYDNLVGYAISRLFHELQHSIQQRERINAPLTGGDNAVWEYIRNKYNQGQNTSIDKLKEIICKVHGVEPESAYTLEYHNIPEERESQDAEEKIRKHNYEKKPEEYKSRVEDAEKKRIFDHVKEKKGREAIVVLFQDSEGEIARRKVLEKLTRDNFFEKRRYSDFVYYYVPTEKLYQSLGVMKEGGSVKAKRELKVAEDWMDAHTNKFDKAKYHYYLRNLKR